MLTTGGLSASKQRVWLWNVFDKVPDADGRRTIVRDWQFLAANSGQAWARFIRLYPDCDPAAVKVELYHRPL